MTFSQIVSTIFNSIISNFRFEIKLNKKIFTYGFSCGDVIDFNFKKKKKAEAEEAKKKAEEEESKKKEEEEDKKKEEEKEEEDWEEDDWD